jgi:hypothetical protein
VDADAAEAAIVARVVRRRSVADLHSLDARHVWTATGTTADGQNPATDAAKSAATNGQGGGQNPANPTATKRPSRGQSTAARVAALVAKNPAITTAEVAKRLGIAERTARRYLSGKP